MCMCYLYKITIIFVGIMHLNLIELLDILGLFLPYLTRNSCSLFTGIKAEPIRLPKISVYLLSILLY